MTFVGTIFAVAVLFGSTKEKPFEQAALIVYPTFYIMSLISVCGIKEVQSARPLPVQTEADDQDVTTRDSEREVASEQPREDSVC